MEAAKTLVKARCRSASPRPLSAKAIDKLCKDERDCERKRLSTPKGYNAQAHIVYLAHLIEQAMLATEPPRGSAAN